MTSQALNRPVDVLAVLDCEIAAIKNTKEMVDFAMSEDRRTAYAEHLSSLTEARAAVAELIGAAKLGGDIPKRDGSEHAGMFFTAANAARLRAAIVAISGKA